MLITRAPVRISLAGGGTDLPAYYEQFGGAALNATIDKYFYVVLNVCETDNLQISSSDYRTFYRHSGNEQLLWDGDQRCAPILNTSDQHRVVYVSGVRVPPGTGLGSSSTVAVALVKAPSTALGMHLRKDALAELLSIEIEKLGEPIGKQDNMLRLAAV